jgi:hypothetical protein
MAYVDGDSYTLNDGRKVSLLCLPDAVVTLIHELEEEIMDGLLKIQEERKNKSFSYLETLQLRSWIFMNGKGLN